VRKPRDFDSEIKALSGKAKLLQEQKLRQLGELVVATGADMLPVEQLAGALMAAAEAGAVEKEAWRQSGAGFFQRAQKRRGSDTNASASGPAATASAELPLDGGTGSR
jgi:hypothetical protein